MNGFELADIECLTCPSCSRPLEWEGSSGPERMLRHGVLMCSRHHTWRVDSGMPNLIESRPSTTREKFVDLVYDILSPVHDMSVSYLLPLLQYPDDGRVRYNYMQKLELGAIAGGSEPVRVLEVGCGTGANFPLIKYGVPDPDKLEIWAIDFNANMVEQCARVHAHSATRVRLALGDAHSLPFADNVFDRVFHVGGINIYRDPARGIEEMARVAKPETPIVVVDEGLDNERDNNPLHRLAFLGLTSLDGFTGAPTSLVPDNCEVLSVTNVSRFYYCMVYAKHGL